MNTVNIKLNIPQSDMHFLTKLVQKMGWGISSEDQASTPVADKLELTQRLYGSIQLPASFNYKQELSDALSQKYGMP